MSIKRFSSVGAFGIGTWQDIKSIWRLNSKSGSTGTWGQIRSMWRLSSFTLVGGELVGIWNKIFSADSLSLSVSSITATNATFSISSSGYSYFKLSISPAAFSQQALGTSTTYTTTALSANTFYEATVQGWTNSTYNSTFTTTDSVTFTTAPATPSLSKNSYTSTSIKIQWSAISGATSYYVSTDGSSYTNAGNVTDYNFTGLSNGTEYTFYVKAYRSSTALYSAVASITDYTAPGAPTLNAATSITSNSATLSWSGGTGTGSYKLNTFSSLSPLTHTASSPYFFNSSTTDMSLSGLSSGSTYYYQILAYAKTNWSGSFSYASPDTKSFTTSSPKAPNPPTGLTTPSSGTSPNLVFNNSSWSAGATDSTHDAAQFYQVYVEASTSSTGTFFAVNSNFQYYNSNFALISGSFTTATNAYTPATAVTVYGTRIFSGKITSTSNTYTWVKMYVRAGNAGGYSAWVSAVG